MIKKKYQRIALDGNLLMISDSLGCKNTVEHKNSIVFFIYNNNKNEKGIVMNKTIYWMQYWHYLTGDFLIM